MTIVSTITILRPTPIAHLAEVLSPLGRAVLCVAVGTAGYVVLVRMSEDFAEIREVDPTVELGVEVATVS